MVCPSTCWQAHPRSRPSIVPSGIGPSSYVHHTTCWSWACAGGHTPVVDSVRGEQLHCSRATTPETGTHDRPRDTAPMIFKIAKRRKCTVKKKLWIINLGVSLEHLRPKRALCGAYCAILQTLQNDPTCLIEF
jgi:hypothetical protein